MNHLRSLKKCRAVAGRTLFGVALGSTSACTAIADGQPPAAPGIYWTVGWGVILAAAVVFGYLQQRRMVQRKTGELRRELFERQLAEKELLASQHSLRRSLAEKEALLKEIHHRVKNNLQIVASLLYLQEEYLDDPKGVEILRESQHRVKSMALIHEQLYGTSDLARIDFGRYVEGLAANLQDAHVIDSQRIRVEVQADRIALGVDMAVPCGLIINELVSNALKHAFAPDTDGRIAIIVRRCGKECLEIKVSDNGVGLVAAPSTEARQPLGLRLIDTLVAQLDGALTVDTSDGTRFSILLNLPEKQAKGKTA